MNEKSDSKMEKIVSLCKRRGFVFQGSEIYGGLKGTWDLGPLGVALNNNIKREWWKMFVDGREDMYGLDAAILMNEKVWEASGHTGAGFADPLVVCNKCGVRHRADHLVDKFSNYVEKINRYMIEGAKPVSLMSTLTPNHVSDESEGVSWEKMSVAHDALSLKTGPLAQRFLNEEVVCPNCGSKQWGEPQQFNLMFETKVGAQGDMKSYLRPETAQGIFVNFKNVVDSMAPKIPFGIAQVGKAFRNEIAPREFLFRVREFEQMEIEYFVEEGSWQEEFEKLRQDIQAWHAHLGLKEENIREFEVPENDLAHYSKRTIDFEYNYPGKGFDELAGFAYRTDHDLKSHEEASGVKMRYVPAEGVPFIPHVLEPSFGVGRAFTAVLCEAYQEDEMNGEVRSYLKLPTHLAPFRVAVSPLLKNKPELVEKAREVFMLLKKEYGNVAYDDNSNVGKRYRRQDEIGTPYCIVIDFDTLGENPDLLDTVTVRHRDTGEQERVKINDLISKIR
jgi:glycyl-tRNA synthetase